MEKYTVTERQGLTLITAPEHNLIIQVRNAEGFTFNGDMAVMEATLYVEQRSFIPACSYLFVLVDADDQPANYPVAIDHFKAAVDFFFRSVLGTDLYVKSIPKSSALCPADVKRYEYHGL